MPNDSAASCVSSSGSTEAERTERMAKLLLAVATLTGESARDASCGTGSGDCGGVSDRRGKSKS